MKTPIQWNEIYYKSDWIGLIELISKVQQEAYNQALDDAVTRIEEVSQSILTLEEQQQEILELKIT